MSPFLSRLAFWILSLTDKHSITLISAYIPTLILSVEADYLFQGWLLPEWHLLPKMAEEAFCLLGPTRGGPVGILLFHSMPALLPLGNLTTSGGLGVKCLQSSLVRYVFPPPVLVPLVLSKFLTEYVKVQLRLFDSGGTSLDGDSLASHSFSTCWQMFLGTAPS